VPSSLHELLALIEHSLGASGRVLAGATIDGRQVTADVEDAIYAEAGRIEITSLTMAEAVAQIATSYAARAAELRTEATDLSQAVLSEPWPEAMPKLARLGERLGAFLQELGGLDGMPGYAAHSAELAAALEHWMDAVGARDAATVCLCFEKSVIPALERLASGGTAVAEASPS
jgi:hypothetical protein